MEKTWVPPGWPHGRPLAVSVSVMLEGWAAPDTPGMGPMGNPLKPGTVDLQARSWAGYGAKVGAWRLLDVLDQEGANTVFYTSGVVAEQFPGSARGDRRARTQCRGSWLEPGYVAGLPHCGAGSRRYRAVRICAHRGCGFAAEGLAQSPMHPERSDIRVFGGAGVCVSCGDVRFRTYHIGSKHHPAGCSACRSRWK